LINHSLLQAKSEAAAAAVKAASDVNARKAEALEAAKQEIARLKAERDLLEATRVTAASSQQAPPPAPAVVPRPRASSNPSYHLASSGCLFS
jgi:hypothetical protein